MPRLLKSTLLGLGFSAGLAVAAYAQSVSTLPPTSGATAPTAPPPITSSTQSIVPNPGSGQGALSEPHYQPPADYDSNASYHPYSTPSKGLNPGSHSSGKEERYQATEQDNAPARHPYTATGFGPKTN
jgi:hypothetical protein